MRDADPERNRRAIAAFSPRDAEVYKRFGQEMAELTINGQPAGVSFWPPHKFPLAGLLTPGENTLTLTLTGSPANRYGKHPVPYGLER